MSEGTKSMTKNKTAGRAAGGLVFGFTRCLKADGLTILLL